jgi:gluconate 2-dehydrogenase gamma chain
MNDPSRRDLFRHAGAVGAVAAISGAQLVPNAEALAQSHITPTAPQQLEALENLTALEADILQAIVARLIPADESGPGAAEAGAAHFIDRALSGPLRGSREAYVTGLAAVDAYALSSKGATFVTAQALAWRTA